MLIDELIELSKNVESKEEFFRYQKKIENLKEELKKEVLELLRKHNFNEDYLFLLLLNRNEGGIGFYDMSDTLAFINAIVDDDNIEKIIELLNENNNLASIADVNWLIEVFKYVKDSKFNTNLLNLIDDRFEITDDEEAYNEAIMVLNVIQKLNYSEAIIDYFDTKYEFFDFGNNGEIEILVEDFDAELFEKHTCIDFYQAENFVSFDMSTQIHIFDSIKKLSDEQKEDTKFLKVLNEFLINEDFTENLSDDDFTALIDWYISLYKEMKQNHSFNAVYNYTIKLVNVDENLSVDNMKELINLYNKNIEKDTVLDLLEKKDVIQNSDVKTLKHMINAIENLDEDSLPVKKCEIYYTIKKGCIDTDIDSTELLLLMVEYNFHPKVLNLICKNEFITLEKLREMLSEKITTTLEDEMEKCSDMNELTNYLMFLKENMEDTETLDLTPKSMIKKREYYNSKTNNETTAPVDKTEN